MRCLSLSLFLLLLFLFHPPATGDTLSSSDLSRILSLSSSIGVPASVTLALMDSESSRDPRAASRRVSGYRSLGLFQLYEAPFNLSDLLSKFWYPYELPGSPFDIYDPVSNAKVALRYLAALHRQYGSWYRALLFYNCGSVTSVPDSTKAYARRIVDAR